MNEQLYFKLHGSSSEDDAEILAQDALDLWRFLDRLKEVGQQRQKDNRPYLTRHEFDRLHNFLGMINLGMILHIVNDHPEIWDKYNEEFSMSFPERTCVGLPSL